MPANREPLAGMGGGAGGRSRRARDKWRPGGAARASFAPQRPLQARPSRSVQSTMLVSATPRGTRPVDGFLLICMPTACSESLTLALLAVSYIAKHLDFPTALTLVRQ